MDLLYANAILIINLSIFSILTGLILYQMHAQQEVVEWGEQSLFSVEKERPFVIETVEGKPLPYSVTLLDAEGVAIPATAFTGARLTFSSLKSGAIINGRNNQDILNAHDVTITANGVLTWKLQEADVTMIDTPKPDFVIHRAVIVFAWNDAGAVVRQSMREIHVTIERARDLPIQTKEADICTLQ